MAGHLHHNSAELTQDMGAKARMDDGLSSSFWNTTGGANSLNAAHQPQIRATAPVLTRHPQIPLLQQQETWGSQYLGGSSLLWSIESWESSPPWEQTTTLVSKRIAEMKGQTPSPSPVTALVPPVSLLLLNMDTEKSKTRQATAATPEGSTKWINDLNFNNYLVAKKK